MNFLKCIERARGTFIFFIADEDFLEATAIDWIIEQIKNKENLSLIIGSVKDIRKGKKKIYYNPGNHYLRKGHEALVHFLFKYSYLSGVVLKKEDLDLSRVKKYVGSLYINQMLMGLAMISGDTLSTSRIFCYLGEKGKGKVRMTSKTPKAEGELFYNPLSRIYQVIYKLKFINEIIISMPKTRKTLLNEQRRQVAHLFISLLFKSPYYFIKLFPNFLKIPDVSNSLIFWKILPKVIIIQIKKLIFHRGNLKSLIRQIISPNYSKIKI